MAITKEAQTARILRMLKNQNRVTNRELNKICFRYSARIKELRDEGHLIVSSHIKDGLWEYSYKGERPEYESSDVFTELLRDAE
jgi:hypothetical protein